MLHKYALYYIQGINFMNNDIQMATLRVRIDLAGWKQA